MPDPKVTPLLPRPLPWSSSSNRRSGSVSCAIFACPCTDTCKACSEGEGFRSFYSWLCLGAPVEEQQVHSIPIPDDDGALPLWDAHSLSQHQVASLRIALEALMRGLPMPS